METLELDKLNEVYFRIKNLNTSQALEIKEHFSCYIEQHWFNPKVKAKIWDGRISFYDWREQTIPIGLFPQFIKFCNKFGYQYKLNFDKEELFNHISDEDLQQLYEVIFQGTEYEPRDYQHEAIKKALKFKRGVIESPTASGKSLAVYSIIRFILGITEGKILLIVPNINLVNQMFSDFSDYGWKHAENFCSLIFHKSDKVDWNRPIIISTWQSIYKKSQSFFEQFDAVLVDETHGASSNSINSCLKKCVNAEYRIGLTGTMPKELINQFTIYGYLGPKIFELKSSELIDKGVLSKIKIANLLLKYPDEIIYRYWHSDDGNIQKYSYNEELDVIYENKDRNKVFNYILNKVDKKQNVLVLCSKISHLKEIKKYLEENFKDRSVYEIYGDIEGDERERIRKLANVDDGVIIVGTWKTMSTGINIKKLHHVIFASSLKSRIKILQSIGRGLRTHETKDKVLIWDIIDDLTWINTWRDKEVKHKNQVYKHWKERLRYYEDQGFQNLTKKINLKDIKI
ncbi:MAG: DEAD/DEAH box helicase family protein [bacterium]